MKTMITHLLVIPFMLIGTSTVVSQGVAINTSGNAPDNSSMLDVDASDKGLLIPRVALVSPTNPITSPATSLLVYNTSTSGTYSTPGFYYFDGTDWVCITCSAPSNNSRTIYRELTTSSSLTVTNSSAPSTNLLDFNYTPINDTVLLQVNVSGRITSSSAPATPGQAWVFRLLLNNNLFKQTAVGPERNFASFNGGMVNLSFTIPVPVTPNTMNNFKLVLAGFFTSSGSITLNIDPASNNQFANIIIYDKPINP